MAVTVRIPTPLRNITKGKDEVQVNGENVKELLDNLDREYNGLKTRIFDDNGNLRRFVNIYVNDEDIRFLNDLSTNVKDGDKVSIIPAIAGGVPATKKETVRVYLSYPPKLIKSPLIWECGNKFKVVTNIRSASVSEAMGLVALELTGQHKEVEKALSWFKKNGVKVEPIEQDVIEG